MYFSVQNVTPAKQLKNSFVNDCCVVKLTDIDLKNHDQHKNRGLMLYIYFNAACPFISWKFMENDFHICCKITYYEGKYKC